MPYRIDSRPPYPRYLAGRARRAGRRGCEVPPATGYRHDHGNSAPNTMRNFRDHDLVREGHGVERSLLLVHAHPDDESIGTGATMAKYAAEGARVTLVTCPLGELGEIIPPDLRHLFPDELGQHRIAELERACAALGVSDHRFLGGEGRYRDSGMMGLPDNDDPRCFWQADVDEAARALVKVIDEVEASVLVTYDAHGFYGHPDHIQAHRVTVRARELTGRDVKLYATG